MESLIDDIASQLGFPLRASVTEAGGSSDPGVNNPPTTVAAQPSFSQLSSNSALHGAGSYVLDHQAPISPQLINHPYNISHAGSDLGSGGPSTSAHMGYVDPFAWLVNALT